MKQLTPTLAVGVAAVALALGGLIPAMAQGTDTSEDCATCHEEISASFALTVHAIGDRGGPSCVTCHGRGLAHMEEGGDPTLIIRPEGRDSEQLCRLCHGEAGGMFSSRSAHADASVRCITCHPPHPTGKSSPNLTADARNDLCASCHPSVAGSFSKPFGHNLDRGGLECVSCHNPHGGSGEQSLKIDRSGEPACLTCHAEKRGPFAFPHVAGVAGDCMSCHEPHGSTNPMALTRPRVDQLCLECHSTIEGGTFGSQPPSFHDLRSPRYRNCTTCHVAVHGSNTSPLLLK
ncbi:MAG: DmsE family decaheme c-type cytochrome [Thermoanaerobaculales bacterium]|jgi:DmsE family decaheme c-type cytochrome|nr:DmsE family decaheme c-type cytochrome [Thermoanaerobaculales bacterium]